MYPSSRLFLHMVVSSGQSFSAHSFSSLAGIPSIPAAESADISFVALTRSSVVKSKSFSSGVFSGSNRKNSAGLSTIRSSFGVEKTDLYWLLRASTV